YFRHSQSASAHDFAQTPMLQRWTSAFAKPPQVHRSFWHWLMLVHSASPPPDVPPLDPPWPPLVDPELDADCVVSSEEHPAAPITAPTTIHAPNIELMRSRHTSESSWRLLFGDERPAMRVRDALPEARRGAMLNGLARA